MSFCHFNSEAPDYEVAYEIRKGLEDNSDTEFRRLLLDVVNTHVGLAFKVEEDPDE